MSTSRRSTYDHTARFRNASLRTAITGGWSGGCVAKLRALRQQLLVGSRALRLHSADPCTRQPTKAPSASITCTSSTMAKRRARIEARVSKLKRKQASITTGGEGEAAVVPPAASHVRKLQKRVRFLDRVKTSALAAKAAVFKRKRKTQGISLGALVCSAFCAAVPAHGTACVDSRFRASFRRMRFRSWKASCRQRARRSPRLSSCHELPASFTRERVSSASLPKRCVRACV